jgi:deazaflavin-dependent oxidoreductase (nitroreductase family)
LSDWNRRVIEEFRANGGHVGGSFEEVPLLLLHHTGARSKLERVTPLAHQRLGDAVAVFASNNGAPTNPGWFHNVVANPAVTVEVGSEVYPARARVAAGEERERIWEAQKAAFPNFARYEQTSGRTIPVVVLDRA